MASAPGSPRPGQCDCRDSGALFPLSPASPRLPSRCSETWLPAPRPLLSLPRAPSPLPRAPGPPPSPLAVPAPGQAGAPGARSQLPQRPGVRASHSQSVPVVSASGACTPRWGARSGRQRTAVHLPPVTARPRERSGAFQRVRLVRDSLVYWCSAEVIVSRSLHDRIDC